MIESTLSEPSNHSLRKIARQGSIALVGIVLGSLLALIIRVVVARYSSQTDYGIYSLALVILTITAMLSGLGFILGATRYIAYFRGKNDTSRVRATISASIKLSSGASIAISLAIFFAADAIALEIFHSPGLVLPLKIFAAGIPFLTLIQVLIAIFRGFDRIEPQIIFRHIVLNSLFLVLLTIAIVIHLPFVAVFYVYLTALVVTFITLVIYTAKKLPQQIGSTSAESTAPITKRLLVFSLPLLGAAMLSMIIMWIDTIMLGYFNTPEIVGLYNVAHPLAQSIALPLNALLTIYLPIATGLYSRKLMPELKRNYTIVTKWLVAVTLPIFLISFLFPKAVLFIFFGYGYIPAADALRILAAGFMVRNLFGPNGTTLVAMGHPRFLIWATLAAAILNIALNILLIPPLGIVGAAIASAVSIVLTHSVYAAKLYSLCRVQPLSKNMLKPATVCIISATLVWAIAQQFAPLSWWLLIILFTIYLGIYGIATLITRSFDKEDIDMLLEIEKRSGIDMAPVKRILKRFLST
ncbi:oligosaccharide flippase family protein [Chloroflexota bacterium]